MPKPVAILNDRDSGPHPILPGPTGEADALDRERPVPSPRDHTSATKRVAAKASGVSQDEIDQLLLINGFLKDDDNSNGQVSLVDEIKDALLDSGRLSPREWSALRDRLKEIEALIPHIDLIIRLKNERRRK